MERAEFRTRFGRVIAVATGAMCALAFGLTVLEDPAAAIRWAPMLALPAAVVWLLYGRPAVVVDDQGVEVRNVLRTVVVPWDAIEYVDTRYTLTVHTADRAVAAWAAPAPGRMQVVAASREDTQHLPRSTYAGDLIRPGDLASTASGQAASYIRRELERRAEDGPAPASTLAGAATVTERWHVVPAAGVVLLAVAAVTLLNVA
jgi:hypothetical protein